MDDLARRHAGVTRAGVDEDLVGLELPRVAAGDLDADAAAAQVPIDCSEGAIRSIRCVGRFSNGFVPESNPKVYDWSPVIPASMPSLV